MANEIEKELAGASVKKAVKEVESELPTFTKEQLAKSRKYSHRCDAINASLKDDEQYTFAQVNEILKQFGEGVND